MLPAISLHTGEVYFNLYIYITYMLNANAAAFHGVSSVERTHERHFRSQSEGTFFALTLYIAFNV